MRNKIKKIYKKITKHPEYIFEKAIYFHQKYRIAKEKNNKILILFYGLFANRYSSKYNLELYGKFGKNLKIWHGNIIINSKAIIGNNVVFQGNNCVGNNGFNNKCPKIGNNVRIGFGSVIIGDITIADNVIIGANSVVNKSILEENVVVAGVPARIVKKMQ